MGPHRLVYKKKEGVHSVRLPNTNYKKPLSIILLISCVFCFFIFLTFGG
jgi:hypothetical protein